MTFQWSSVSSVISSVSAKQTATSSFQMDGSSRNPSSSTANSRPRKVTDGISHLLIFYPNDCVHLPAPDSTTDQPLTSGRLTLKELSATSSFTPMVILYRTVRIS